MPITFGPQSCGSLAPGRGSEHEWLVTDGLGGFATGTVAGLRTRRHHGLLAVAEPGSAVRRTALAALDLTLTLPSGAKVRLFTHEWESGAVAPDGHRYLETFTLLNGLPRWRWRVGDVVIERELAMLHGRSVLGVVHRVLAAPGPIGLAVAAMCTWRGAPGERRATGPGLRVEHVEQGAIVEDAYRIGGPGWQPGGEWHLGARTRADATIEDLWLAGTFSERVNSGGIMEITAWAGALADRPPNASTVIAAAHERAHLLVTAAKADDSGGRLALAADNFVIRAADGPDVIAGYPWFGGHLGDTMTSYEGLFLETGRAEEGRELLTVRTTAAARAARASGPWGPHNSLDAPLWLVHAVDRHVTRTGDSDLAAALVGPLTRLLRAHLDGRGPLRVDPADELVRLDGPPTPENAQGTRNGPNTGAGPGLGDGEPGSRNEPGRGNWEPGSRNGPGSGCGPGGGAAPLRIGKAVEINALWVNALAALVDLLAEAGRDGGKLRARHAQAQAAFAARFRAPDGWLYDVIEGPAATYPLGAGAFQDDPTLRPNQLFAWSLPHAPLAGADARAQRADRAAIRTIGGALLTPLGLRTLAPSEYGYSSGRDGAVWPWLIGPYVAACAATGLPTEGLLTGLEAHVREWGVGSVSETAEGDAPHPATGCPFSARSVAELLRARRLAS